MENKSVLSDFYQESLYPILKKLDDYRQQIKYRVLMLIAFFSLTYTILFFVIFSLFNSNSYLLSISIVLYVVIAIFIYKNTVKEYKKDFKDMIIRPLIAAIDSKLSYSSHMHVPQLLFNRSKIFPHPDKINGNDFVKGVIDQIPLQFSNLYAQKLVRDTHGRENWTTLFRGFFIVCEVNKYFKANTIIVSNIVHAKYEDTIGNLVKIDNKEFEKEFRVYSSDPIEARDILSNELIKKLLELKKRSNFPICVSFLDNHINIAIDYNKDMFEPSIFNSLLEYKVAIDYVDTLHMSTNIIKEIYDR